MFNIKSEVSEKHNRYYISIRAYLSEQEVGFLLCNYWKEDGYLNIIDIDTHFQHRGKGLGLLRLQELLDILKENNLQLGTVVAEEVGSLSIIPESKEKTESFFKNLGFQRDGKSSNWYVDGDTLKNKLDEKLVLPSLLELSCALQMDKQGLIAERKYIYFSIDHERLKELYYGHLNRTKEAIEERRKIMRSWDQKSMRELNKEIAKIHIIEDKVKEKIYEIKYP